MASFPDYYAILDIPKNASTEDIRQSYRKESLKSGLNFHTSTLHSHITLPRTHPDRLFDASTEEKKAATVKFQVSESHW
jgi:hypothetical protein